MAEEDQPMEEKPIEEQPVEKGTAIIQPASIEPMFADLSLIKYALSAYLGGFGILFVLALFLNLDDPDSDSYLIYVPTTEEFDFGELYTYFFLLQVAVLLAIPILLVRKEEFVSKRGHVILLLISLYLFLSFLTLITFTLSDDDIGYDFLYVGLIALSLGFAYFGLSYSPNSKIPNEKRSKVMGLSSLIYGFSLFLSTHELSIRTLLNEVDAPPFLEFYGFIGFEESNEIFSFAEIVWFYPTLQEWRLGGILWILIGMYFLVMGYNLGIQERDFYKFEDLIWIICSISVFYFNLDLLILTIQYGFTNFVSFVILLLNLVGFYLAYELNFPLKDWINNFRS